MKVEQRNVTRNQSTADYSGGCVFIWSNKFTEGTLTVGTEAVVKNGMLVVRDTAVENGYKLADTDNLADVVGVLKVGDCDVELPADTALNVMVCTSGTVDGNLLVFSDGITLKTTVDNKSLLDVIQGLGITVDTTGVEHTKFDN